MLEGTGPAPYRARLRWYMIAGLTFVAIVGAAALLHTMLRPRVMRPPMDFVPASARAVVALDLRPGSPSASLLARTWPAADREALARRAAELAQRMVDWAGLEMDVRTQATRWFGGEAIAISLGGPSVRSFAPRSFVLIARATDQRRALHDLDGSVAELARQGGWHRTVLRARKRSITVWGRPGGESAIAYAATDGCILIAPSRDLLALCLDAARGEAEKLAGSPAFARARRDMPEDAFLWGYLDASDAAAAATDMLPALRKGLPGLARRYLELRRAGAPPPKPVRGGGAITIAVTPARDGLLLRAAYLGELRTRLEPGPQPARLLELLPKEALAFALLTDLPHLKDLFRPASASPGTAARRPTIALGPLGLVLRSESLPQSALIAAIPGTGARRPAVIAAFAGEDAQRKTEWVQKLTPLANRVTIGGVEAFATDEQALRRVEAAAASSADRLPVAGVADAAMRLWARPAALSQRFRRVDRIESVLREEPAGASLEISVTAEPRYLLGQR